MSRHLDNEAFARHVQRFLAGRSYGVGAIDGHAGARTRAAFDAFVQAIPQPAKAEPEVKPLSDRSEANLRGVHPDLVRVIRRSAELSPVPFTVIEGLRTAERQRELVAQGASKTLHSRHLTGHAVDLAPHRPDGRLAFDWPLYHLLAPAVKQAADELGVPITWGGDWKSFPDGPHFELPRDRYPA
jgi:peptidoglycan L-alanyl-D-glutamate endopeptidase CwlK